MTASAPPTVLRRSALAKSLGAAASSARRRIAEALTAFFALAISSALTERIFSRISATCELLREFHESVELGARRAALDQLECFLHAVLEGRGLTPDVDGGAGVEGHDVSRGSTGVLECGHDDPARFLDRRDAQGPRVVHRQSESLRVDQVLANFPVLELSDHRLSAHRYL